MTMTKEELLKDMAEIMEDCDYVIRRVQILKSNARSVTNALMEIKEQEAEHDERN